MSSILGPLSDCPRIASPQVTSPHPCSNILESLASSRMRGRPVITIMTAWIIVWGSSMRSVFDGLKVLSVRKDS